MPTIVEQSLHQTSDQTDRDHAQHTKCDPRGIAGRFFSLTQILRPFCNCDANQDKLSVMPSGQLIKTKITKGGGRGQAQQIQIIIRAALNKKMKKGLIYYCRLIMKSLNENLTPNG